MVHPRQEKRIPTCQIGHRHVDTHKKKLQTELSKYWGVSHTDLVIIADVMERR